MKSAAKRDMSCESQNSANHAILERIRRSRVFPGACPSERRSQKSQPETIENRGRKGDRESAETQSPGNEAHHWKPHPTMRDQVQSFRRERLRVQLISGVAALNHSTRVDLGISFRLDRRRPWSVRPGSEESNPPLSNHDLRSGKITR
jgi:hypothetical protein